MAAKNGAVARTRFGDRRREQVGGRPHIYDVGTDGSRCEWARVLSL